jgi:hypothetical protein
MELMGGAQILLAASVPNVILRALDLRELFFIDPMPLHHQQEIDWLLY